MVLSSKIKVSRISKKSVFGVTFGSLGEHFGHHFGRLFAPWGSFGRPLDSQSGAKVQKRVKKEGTNEVLNRPGRPERPKGRQRAPRPSKMDPKSSKNRRKNDKKNILPTANFAREDRVDRSPSSANFTKNILCFQYVSQLVVYFLLYFYTLLCYLVLLRLLSSLGLCGSLWLWLCFALPCWFGRLRPITLV